MDFKKIVWGNERIKENDESVPYLYNGYYYITRFETGKDYPFILEKGKPFSKEKSCWIAMN
jgi:oligopeptidase B